MPTMLQVQDIKAFIFDVDDTLLSNYPDDGNLSLHERSRLETAHIVGRRHGSKGLMAFTAQQAEQAFLDAKVHALPSVIWQMLIMAGEVTTDEVEPDHPLLREMMELKKKLHLAVLREHGREVPGAGDFVRAIVAHGFGNKIAIASTAVRPEIDIFLEIHALDKYFPDEKIISYERFSRPKPHPEPYQMALERLGLGVNEAALVVAVEDDPRGIMSAKAAGLFTCAVTTRYSREALSCLEIAPDFIFESYAELADALELRHSIKVKTITPKL